MLFFVNRSFKNTDVRKVTIFFIVIKSVSDNKFIGNGVSEVVYVYINKSSVGLIDKSTKLNAVSLSVFQMYKKI